MKGKNIKVFEGDIGVYFQKFKVEIDLLYMTQKAQTYKKRKT